MTIRREEKLGAKGEKIAKRLMGGKATTRTAPFDVVNFQLKVAYEVKTVSAVALNGTNKIHIEQGSWDRKQAFLEEYGLEGVLLAVVIASPKDVKVYSMPLNCRHIRITRVIREGTLVS